MKPVVCVIAVGMLLACGCNLARVTTADESPTMPSSLVPSPVPSPVSDGGWKTVAPGIERRTMEVAISGWIDPDAIVVRLDPALVTFRVHYSPFDPMTLPEWYNALPEPSVIINAAFFDQGNRALGLLVSDSQYFGQTFSGFGGMFQVTEAGVRVRSLVREPYQGEALLQAVQAFPMLIEAGGGLAPQGDSFDQRSRRSLIGQDRAGRIIVATIPNGTASLAELQDWLVASDLNLDIAFNLDGGRSAGMGIYGPQDSDLYPSLDDLPSVIAVYAR